MKKILALLLAVVMVMALAACGGGSDKEAAAPAPEAPVAAPADNAPPADAPAPPPGDASGEMGEASGEFTGDPPEPPELAVPTEAHTKDFEGYRQYALEALENDPNVPAGAREEIHAGLEAATSPDAEDFGKLTDAGLIMNYEDFLAY